jgi:L-alanine-DL-glutamate epimerase-like enolase superfamily enzyme
MKISRIELYLVKIPLAEDKPGFFHEKPYFLPSWIPGFRQSEVRFYLLKLVTDSGIEGYAATTAMGGERKGLGDLLGNYLLGINPLDIRLVNQRIQEMSYLGMRNTWIDAAVWDIIGKVRKEPLYKILGGSGGYIYPYASTGSTHDHDVNYAAAIIKKHMDEGFRGIKLRVKSDRLEPMLAYVAAARKSVGTGMDIMVDANQGWPVDVLDETPKWSVDFALSFARGLEEFNVRWLEEPINRGNFEGLACLRRNTQTPIAGGELNSSWRDFKTMLEMGCLDVYQPDACLAGGNYAGGITVVYWLIREIEKRNQEAGETERKARFSPHTWTTGLGFAVALQLYGIVPQEKRGLLEFPLEGNWKLEYWARFLKNNFHPDREGRIDIPNSPGLGIEIDWDIINRFGKRIFVATEINTALRAVLDRGVKEALYLKKKKEEMLARSKKAEFSIPDPIF